MKYVIAGILLLAGIVGGIYVGAYLMFYMGIVHIVTGVAASPVSAGLVAWGIVQVFLLWEILGGAVFMFFAIIAAAVAGTDSPGKRIAASRRRRASRKA